MGAINNRIQNLRRSMEIQNIDAYIIPSSDAHQSEYVGEYALVREWISGFDGSAGTVVITKDHAGLWTDGRYFIQAEDQISSSSFELHKLVKQGHPEYIEWCIDTLPLNATIACNGFLFSKGQIERFESMIGSQMQFKYNIDLIPEVWTGRPGLPTSMIFEHDIIYTGKSRKDKIQDLRKQFSSRANHYLITGLDDIAYLLNLRAADVDCNPLFISYAIVREKDTLLFVNKDKLSKELISKLKEDSINIHPYDSIMKFMNDLDEDSIVLYSNSDISMGLYRAINGKKIAGDNYIRHTKGIKNQTEIANTRNAMEKDGVALTRLYMWIENTVKDRSIKETEVREKLHFLRSQQDLFIGDSFGAIVGYKGNGAIIHYSPQEETCANIENNGMLLIDSGGQYLDGTTDTTRTIHLGEPSDEEKMAYTMVLKGHIAIDKLKFPVGTKGIQIDALARMYLWSVGLNYGHGTGHGVGFFMNVHEGPQGISSIWGVRSKTPFEPGMITSNEPGFYKNNAFGIRIENLVLTKEDEKNEYGQFLSHETLTLFPIATNLIDKKLMNEDEISWLNNYHKEVYKRLSTRLEDDEKTWMKSKCLSI